MASLDYESKLDEALKYLAEGKSDDAIRSMPEAADLIKVAERLQLLKSAPEPHLAQGRDRFMSEAARLRAPVGARPSLRRWLPRPVLAFLTVFILLASGMVFVTMRASMGNWSNTPNPTSSPTLTGTPTNAAFGRTDGIPMVPTRANRSVGMSRPEPAPTPNPPREHRPSVLITILEWQFSNA
jgi:hypothetical protein